MSIIPAPIGPFSIGDTALTVIAGPCMAESEGLCMRVAEEMKAVCAALGFNYIFKASFDKANRTSLGSERGAGILEGLGILASVKKEFDVPVTTDIHLTDQAAVAAEVGD